MVYLWSIQNLPPTTHPPTSHCSTFQEVPLTFACGCSMWEYLGKSFSRSQAKNFPQFTLNITSLSLNSALIHHQIWFCYKWQYVRKKNPWSLMVYVFGYWGFFESKMIEGKTILPVSLQAPPSHHWGCWYSGTGTVFLCFHGCSRMTFSQNRWAGAEWDGMSMYILYIHACSHQDGWRIPHDTITDSEY